MVWNTALASSGHPSCLCPLPVCLPTPSLLADGEAGMMTDRVVAGGECHDTMQALFSNRQDIGA